MCLTVDKCPYKKKTDICHGYKDLGHVEGVRLSDFKCPAESNNTVCISESQRKATPRKTVMMVQRSMFWIGVVGPPGDLGVKERNPPKDSDKKNKSPDAIPCLHRIQLISGNSQRLVGAIYLCVHDWKRSPSDVAPRIC